MKLFWGVLASVAAVIAFAVPATASADVTFERAFGFGVAGGTSFENCTVATGCVDGEFDNGPAGAMEFPADVVADPHGGIFVADSAGARIDRFLIRPDGTAAFDRTFGVGVQVGAPGQFRNCVSDCQSGEHSEESGGLSGAWAMVFDDQGRLLVADYGFDRVSRFLIAPDGTATFDRAFGYDVDASGGPGGLEACTDDCRAGQSDSGLAGELDGPDGLAFDAAGGLLVGEWENERISRITISAAGVPEFDRAFGLDVIPGGGTGFENCTAVTGCQEGSATGAAGSAFDNYFIEVGPDGRIFATDAPNNRVSVYTRSANGTIGFQQAFGEDVIPGGATSFETCTSATGCQAGAETGAAGSLNSATGLAIDPSGALFVSTEGDSRINRFVPDGSGGFRFDYAYGKGVAGGAGAEVCTATCVAGQSGAEAGAFFNPEGLFYAPDGRLYVAGGDNYRIDVIGVGPTVTVTKALSPASDPGRFDLKVGGVTVKAGAAGGDSGSVRTAAGPVTVSETAASPANPLSNYDSRIDCGSVAGTGPSLTVPDVSSDLACTITNTRKVAPPTKAKFTKLVLRPKKKRVKAGKKVRLTVRVTNTGQTMGTAVVRISSSAKKKARAPKKVKVTVRPGRTASKKFTVKTRKRKKGKVTIKAKLGKRTAKTVLRLRK
jgi:hypothetical protein